MFWWLIAAHLFHAVPAAAAYFACTAAGGRHSAESCCGVQVACFGAFVLDPCFWPASMPPLLSLNWEIERKLSSVQ